MFKTNFSGNNKIWGIKKLWGYYSKLSPWLPAGPPPLHINPGSNYTIGHDLAYKIREDAVVSNKQHQSPNTNVL